MKYYNLYPSSHRTSIRYPPLSHVCPIRTCQPLNSPSFYDRAFSRPVRLPDTLPTYCLAILPDSFSRPIRIPDTLPTYCLAILPDSFSRPVRIPDTLPTYCLQFYRIASAVPSEYRTLCQHTALQFYRIASAAPSEYRTLYHPIMRVSSNTSPSAMGVESIPVRTVSPPFVMHHHSSLDTSAVSPSTVVMYNP